MTGGGETEPPGLESPQKFIAFAWAHTSCYSFQFMFIRMVFQCKLNKNFIISCGNKLVKLEGILRISWSHRYLRAY